MGMIAEQLKESPERWIVTASCSETCYAPIFHRELAALLFVEEMERKDWSRRAAMDSNDEVALANEIVEFVNQAAPCVKHGAYKFQYESDDWAEFQGPVYEALMAAKYADDADYLAEWREENPGKPYPPYECTDFHDDWHTYESARARCRKTMMPFSPIPIVMEAFHVWQAARKPAVTAGGRNA
jgi:hypothetical protein